MSLSVMISSAFLIISLVVSGIKFVDWLSHSDPRSIMRMGRFGLLALALASVPALMTLLALQEWTGAMSLGAAMLLALVLVNWRRLVPRRAFRPLWVDEPGYGPPQRFESAPYPPGPDPELARRAAIVLQDYIALAGGPDGPSRLAESGPRHAEEDAADGGSMGVAEATALLGLEPGASAPQIRSAHRRLMQLVHPDHGGTDYLAMKINRAKDVLLAVASREKPAGTKQGAARKPAAPARKPASAHAPGASATSGKRSGATGGTESRQNEP